VETHIMMMIMLKVYNVFGNMNRTCY